MLLTEMMVRLSSTEGFSATILSYNDLQSVTCSIRNGLEILKEAVLWRISESMRLTKLDQSTDESAALASAAKVLRQTRPDLELFQSTRHAGEATSVAFASANKMRHPCCDA